jgi:hypothetical protein
VLLHHVGQVASSLSRSPLLFFFLSVAKKISRSPGWFNSIQFQVKKWPSIDPDEIHELAYSALFHGRYRNKVRRKNINQKGTRPDNRPDFPPLCDTFSTLLGFFLKSVGHLIHSYTVQLRCPALYRPACCCRTY